MVVQYKGMQKGISTKFSVKIIRNNIDRKGPKYSVNLSIGDRQLPTFRTSSHKSLSNCLKEVYLFINLNDIKLDASSEKLASKYVLYESGLYNYHKDALFMS